jgi:hypothetical protein
MPCAASERRDQLRVAKLTRASNRRRILVSHLRNLP